MTAEWSTVRVRDLIAGGALQVSDGYRVTNRELGATGIPFVRGGDIGNDGRIDDAVKDHILPEFADRVTGKLTQPGDVAFITKGTVGRVGSVRDDQPAVVFAPQVCYWRSLDADLLDARFLFYLLSGQQFQANLDAVKTHGSMAADYVSITDQQSFLLDLPPIEDQRAISEILGAIDDRIDLNRRTNATLQQLVFALALESTIGMSRGVDDGISSLGCMARQRRLTVQPSEVPPETPHIGLEHMPRASIALSSWGEARDVDSAKARYRLGDVLFGKLRPYFRKVGIAPNDGICSTDVLVIEPLRTEWTAFVIAHLASDPLIEHATGGSDGTRMPRTSWEWLARYPVRIPPADHAARVHTTAQPAIEQVLANVHQNRALATLRDTLLPRLLSGELRVRDAEPLVAAAV